MFSYLTGGGASGNPGIAISMLPLVTKALMASAFCSAVKIVGEFSPVLVAGTVGSIAKRLLAKSSPKKIKRIFFMMI
ncbi:MAG: hypothetical protein WC812_03950 [Candidatus Pacearchaeota archaeon]